MDCRTFDFQRSVVRPVRTTQHKMVFRGGGILEHGEPHVEHREPSKGAVDVTLTCATFSVEGELLNSGEALKVPALQGKGGAYYGVPGIIKVDEPLRNREGNSKAQPAQ